MSSLPTWLLYPMAAGSLLALLQRAESWRSSRRTVLAGLLGLWSVWLAVPTLRTVVSNLARPREWDFVCFWLWGRLGALHANFYDPAVGLALGQQINVSEELRNSVLSVGFWYPPPSMLLFAPLGLLDMRTAALLWYAVQGAFALGAVFLLSRTFLREQGALGLGAVACLLAMDPSAKSTVWFAQSNFMLLCLFLLLFRDRNRARAGLWIALGIIVKPYFVFFLAYYVLRRAYRVLGVAAGVLLVALGLSTLLFGLAPLVTFLHANPASRVPGYIYGEPMNQSLLGTLLRMSTGTLEGSLRRQPLYLGIGALIALASAWATRRRGDADTAHGVLLALLVALLLYPGTLAHYSLLLLAPLLALWSERRSVPWGAPLAIGAFALVYGILGWDRFETYNFWANLSVWVASVMACVYGTLGAPRELAKG